MVNGSSKTQARLNKAGIASELRPFMVFVVRHFHFLERSLSAALSKTSIFMPNKWHTMGLGNLCISTFQNFLVVGSMPSSLASLALQALWSVGMEVFPLYPAGEDVVILVSIAVPPCPCVCVAL